MGVVASSMTADELTVRLQQQELVAQFGVFALTHGPLSRLLDEACRLAAVGLDTPFAKVLRVRPETGDLIVEAGIGWHVGVVGIRTLGGGIESPAGFALHTGEAVVCNHLAQEERFRVPSLLAEHGVQSAINVLIGRPEGAHFGVLEVDSTRRNEFVQADTAFLQSLANVLAAGLTRAAHEQSLDRLLQEKDLLMREVHHRVKNSLQLVRTMIALQSRTASDEVREQLDMAAGRIMSVAAVHQRLYEGGSVAEGDAAVYLTGLLDDMQEMLVGAAAGRTISLDADTILLPADTLTPLGLIVSELVTNGIKYGAGEVRVRLRQAGSGLQVVVEDEGTGFPADGASPTGLGMRLVTALAKGGAGQAVQVDRSVAHGRVVVTINR